MGSSDCPVNHAAGLGVLLSVDLMTQTHDPASLRVYRGPGLLAFSLMCAAFSLRTWRRNGVACDELIFLPGTKLQRKLQSPKKRKLSVMEDSEEFDVKGDTEMVPLTETSLSTMDENDTDDKESSKKKLFRSHTFPPVRELQSLSYNPSWDDVDDTYAPSATVVFGGGLDLAIPVLFNFHLFTVATSHQRQAERDAKLDGVDPEPTMSASTHHTALKSLHTHAQKNSDDNKKGMDGASEKGKPFSKVNSD